MFLLVNGFGNNGPKIRRTRLEPPLNETAKVSDLRARVSDIINRTPDSFILMHCGITLVDDDVALTAANIRPTSSSIHVLPKPSSRSEPVVPKTMSEEEMQQFMIAFGMAFHNPAFNRIVKRLRHRESLENLVAACPDLAKDPVACAFLMKPELLISLLDAETLKYVLERHPGLVEAANFLAAAVHEEKPSTSNEAGSGNPDDAPAPFAYNLDEISDDDEEMEAAAPQDQRVAAAARPIITPDQLAAALASAQQGSLFGGVTGLLGQNQPRPTRGSEQTLPTSGPSTSSASGSRPGVLPPSSAGFITSDQLAAALAAASPLFAAAAQQQQVRTVAPRQITGAAPPPPLSNIESSLSTMREMGIVDEGLARRALTVMGGDLQAAIDLIFSGWLGEDDSAN